MLLAVAIRGDDGASIGVKTMPVQEVPPPGEPGLFFAPGAVDHDDAARGGGWPGGTGPAIEATGEGVLALTGMWGWCFVLAMGQTQPMSRLREIFSSFDSDGNSTVDPDEIETYLLGIGIRDRRARTLVKRAIVEGRGGRLDWERFVDISHHLVPPGIADRHGRLDLSQVDPIFDRIAGSGRPTASVSDIERYTRSTMPFFLRPFSRVLVHAAANGVIGILSRDGERFVRREELRELVEAIVQEKANTSKRR